MTTVTTTRPVNLGQLSTELGGAPLTMTDYGNERVIDCDTVPEDELQAAVDAHDAQPQPDPEPGDPEPAPPSFEARIQAQMDEMSDLMMEILLMGEL